MAGPQKVYDIAQIIAEARLKKPRLVFDFGADGKYDIDPPELWSDEVHRIATNEAVKDPTALARYLFGDQYEAYAAAARKIDEGGLASSLLNLVLEQYQSGQGASLGESKASASS